ncbi:regulatory protein RecX [Polycladomyces subterraneus]|uniref:Regulatory protein RecX n=1 Tax=Polycladomyces subterraneus TaxID=1016997 RepID=A0ABT8INN4_9BACL|nr:RecX family transcriptional regulator [Polycladomyces subterraneus]MDN4594411.1 RecX family transcriptional regulator [Polycladomyces subterraneus]
MKQEPGTIIRIERQPGTTARYRVIIEGCEPVSVHEDVLVKMRLTKGRRVDPVEIDAVLEEEERNKVWQAALKYLQYKPRTALEVERYLIGKGFAAPHVRAAMDKLNRYGYIDDRRFAAAWVEQRRGNGRGRLLLRKELEQKGIAADIIDEVLAEVPEEADQELARSLAEKRYERLRRYPWPTVERRLGHYLLRRGFPQSLVYSILQSYRERHRDS